MISNRCQYALRAMLELTHRGQDKPVSIGEIARAQDIPPRFLEAILRQLKQAGLTQSIRGKEGGYCLTRNAENISMGEVIRIFESGLTNPPNSLSHQGVFDPIWEQAQAALNTVYDNISFYELAEKDRALKGTHGWNYSI